MVLAAMPAQPSFKLLGESVDLILKHLEWSPDKFGAQVGRTRQWVYRVVSGKQKGIPLPLVDKVAYVFTEALGYEIRSVDLLQPEWIANRLKNPVALPVTPSSNAGEKDSSYVQQLAAEVGQLQSSRAALHSALFDIHSALHRYIGDRGSVPGPQTTLKDAPGPSNKPRPVRKGSREGGRG